MTLHIPQAAEVIDPPDPDPTPGGTRPPVGGSPGGNTVRPPCLGLPKLGPGPVSHIIHVIFGHGRIR